MLTEKRSAAPKVTTAAGDKDLIIESKINRRKTAAELTAKLNSSQQQSVLLSTVKNQLRSMGFRMHSHQENPAMEGELAEKTYVQKCITGH